MEFYNLQQVYLEGIKKHLLLLRMVKHLKALFVKQNIPIVVILIVAAFMRMYRIDEYLTFLGDEGRDVLVVKHIVDGVVALFSGNFHAAQEGLTLLGPTASVGGFFLGPIYYYFMAPFLALFNFNPVGPAVMVALIGVATVLLVYIIAKEFFSYGSAIVASLLYAVSPLVIVYSRSSWNPNVVPFFALLMLCMLYKAVMHKSWKLFIFSGFLFGILLQLHYLATFLGVVAGAYILVTTMYGKRAKMHSFTLLIKRYLLFGVGLIIGWFPFLLFEVRHGFQNFSGIYNFIASSGDTGGNGRYFIIVQDIFFRLFGRLIFAFPRVEDLKLYPSYLLELWGLAIYLIAISSTVYILLKMVKLYTQQDTLFNKYVLLSLWLFFTLFLFGFYKKPIYDYYLSIAFPLPFLLFAGLLSYLFTKGKVIVVILLLLLSSIVVLNIYFRPFRFIGNHQLRQVRTISEFVLSQTDGKPFNFAVISSGGNSDHAYRYFFEVHDRHPVTIEFPGADPERTSITDQLLIVCESNPCSPLGYPLWEVAGFGQAEIVGEWPVSVVKVYKLEHYTPED